jgi:hypothetical protein
MRELHGTSEFRMSEMAKQHQEETCRLVARIEFLEQLNAAHLKEKMDVIELMRKMSHSALVGAITSVINRPRL